MFQKIRQRYVISEKSSKISNRNNSPSAHSSQSRGLHTVAEIELYETHEVVVRQVVLCQVLVGQCLMAGMSLSYSTLGYVSDQINLCSVVGMSP